MTDHSLFPDECVDLIYLDPPLQPHRGAQSEAREVDPYPYEPVIFVNPKFWRWDDSAKLRHREIQENGTVRLRAVMESLHVLLGKSAMFAYLCHMTPRMQEAHRVLKRTGSLFLHCDPMASQFLRLIMGALFGHKALINEIVWQRVQSGRDALHTVNQIARIHDTILYFRKSDKGTFHMPTVAGSSDYMDHYYPHTEYTTGRRYRLGDVTSARKAPHSNYSWHIKRPLPDGRWMGDLGEEYKQPMTGWEYQSIEPYKGRYWALPYEIMRKAEMEDRVVYGRTGYPHIKRYQKDLGIPVQDIWQDIPPLSGDDLLYPSQKPRLLMERLIAMASNPGDVILDPFAGAGATLDAVEMLNRLRSEEPPRRWLGIESSPLGMNLIKHRLARFAAPVVEYEIHGETDSVEHARQFAKPHPLWFQYWALGLIGARPAGKQGTPEAVGVPIVGLRHFKEKGAEHAQIIAVQALSVPVERVHVERLLDICSNLEASLGVIITTEHATSEAQAASKSSGEYHSVTSGAAWPRVQIATIGQLLEETNVRGDHPDLPLPPRFIGEQFM